LATLYGRSENPASAFSGRTLCLLAPQKYDYQSELLIIVFFGVPNPKKSLEKTAGARLVFSIIPDTENRLDSCTATISLVLIETATVTVESSDDTTRARRWCAGWRGRCSLRMTCPMMTPLAWAQTGELITIHRGSCLRALPCLPHALSYWTWAVYRRTL